MQVLQRLFAPKDLTKGNSLKGIILFAIPLVIGNFVQQLYSTVDAIVVGNYVGDAALGAVGLSLPVLNILIVLFLGLSTGVTIVVSQAFGAKDRMALTHSVGTTISLTFWTALFIGIIGMTFSRPLLILLGTPESMLDMASDYLFVLMAGVIGGAYYNILSGILRGLGDSVGPLLYLVIASILNIILDILFITAFGMKTEGVALATVISQSISAILCYRKLTRMTDVLDVNRSTIKIHKPTMMKIVKLGLPTSLTQIIFSTSSILIQPLTNSLGENLVTAITAVMRVDGFAMMPNFTFGITSTTFVGQNFGAHRLDRVKQGTKHLLFVALSTSTLLTLAILLFGDNIMHIFTDTQVIVDLGVQMLHLLAVGYIVFAGTEVLMGVMRGLGHTTAPMWASIISTVVIRLPVAYIWAYVTRSPEYPHGDPMSIYGSILVAWIISFLITTILYKRIYNRVMEKENN